MFVLTDPILRCEAVKMPRANFEYAVNDHIIPDTPFERSVWRVIHTPAAAGPWNMAVDEAILEAAGQHLVPPTLRLYAWQPACLSIGYTQEIAGVDRSALARSGWLLVRRPTGGRAVLHVDELTYSVCAPSDEPRLAGTVLSSYARLAQALLHALLLLGLPAQTQEVSPPPAGAPGPVCFELPSNHEITVAGKKLVGSAQARHRTGVLQHGSLPLYGDLTRITRVLQFADENARQNAAARLLERATTVAACSGGRIVAWNEAAAAIEAGFTQTLNLQCQRGELTDFETRRAAELVEQKYANRAWSERY